MKFISKHVNLYNTSKLGNCSKCGSNYFIEICNGNTYSNITFDRQNNLKKHIILII